MGEYAKYEGTRIKIGSCESLFGLRWDQAHLVEPLGCSVDPVRDRERGVRFRFPFPSEDGIAPGEFVGEKSLAVPGLAVYDGLDHRSVQFTANAGALVVLLPCPADSVNQLEGVTVGGRGAAGVSLVEQRWVDGRLLPVLKCNGCGARYRAGDRDMVWGLRESLLRLALVADSDERSRFWQLVCERAVPASLVDSFDVAERVSA